MLLRGVQQLTESRHERRVQYVQQTREAIKDKAKMQRGRRKNELRKTDRLNQLSNIEH